MNDKQVRRKYTQEFKLEAVRLVKTQYCSYSNFWPRIVFVSSRRQVAAWHEPRRCWALALG